MRITLGWFIFILGFISGSIVNHIYLLSKYESAPNFPFIKPTPAYILKHLPENLKGYKVVLEPQDR